MSSQPSLASGPGPDLQFQHQRPMRQAQKTPEKRCLLRSTALRLLRHRRLKHQVCSGLAQVELDWRGSANYAARARRQCVAPFWSLASVGLLLVGAKPERSCKQEARQVLVGVCATEWSPVPSRKFKSKGRLLCYMSHGKQPTK